MTAAEYTHVITLQVTTLKSCLFRQTTLYIHTVDRANMKSQHDKLIRLLLGANEGQTEVPPQ